MNDEQMLMDRLDSKKKNGKKLTMSLEETEETEWTEVQRKTKN